MLLDPMIDEEREAAMKIFFGLALIAVLLIGAAIFLGACSSGSSSSSSSSSGGTTIQNNTQGIEAASGTSQGINMALGTTQAFSSLINVGLVDIVGIQAPQPGTFGNFEQTPAMSRLVNVTSKFATARSAKTAASGIIGAPSRQFTLSGSGSCPDGGSYAWSPSSNGIAAITFSGCRENDVQADGEFNIVTLAPTLTGYSLSGTLGSSSTPTAFTLQDFGPGYSTLISKTTMTGFSLAVAVTVSGTSVTSLTVTATGSMSISDDTSGINYSVTVTNLSDTYALSTSGTGTTTTYTTNGSFAESWPTSTGSDSIAASFTNLQLIITAGTASQDMSVGGTLGITFTPATCLNGSFTLVTNSPIVFSDALGYTTGGELTVNGATTITYNSDGSITVATGGQSQTFASEFDLTQICPIATFGGVATHTVTYNGNNSASRHAPVDSAMYQQGQTVTVQRYTDSLVKMSLRGWQRVL